ncbi:unnamed protein product [Polarella glacialis]|uniref:Uncharacterized protein n=1 Tax=Polarella glacialis TaxID=89957 RepID=A0A813EWY1_POLGL|nr:unnamed protein product [Polarella glacialis]CAE8634339.1 unnamed protein product [Polarella glacialis]CAE8700916.1 unnamed protein product [Polarella glacialis]
MNDGPHSPQWRGPGDQGVRKEYSKRTQVHWHGMAPADEMLQLRTQTTWSYPLWWFGGWTTLSPQDVRMDLPAESLALPTTSMEQLIGSARPAWQLHPDLTQPATGFRRVIA